MLKLIISVVVILSVSVPLAYADSDSSAQGIEAYRQKGYSVKTITPIFSQLLMTALPQGFKPVFEKARDYHYIRESVLEGQSKGVSP